MALTTSRVGFLLKDHTLLAGENSVKKVQYRSLKPFLALNLDLDLALNLSFFRYFLSMNAHVKKKIKIKIKIKITIEIKKNCLNERYWGQVGWLEIAIPKNALKLKLEGVF